MCFTQGSLGSADPGPRPRNDRLLHSGPEDCGRGCARDFEQKPLPDQHERRAVERLGKDVCRGGAFV
eukprot:3334654-Rhodomonas_salina.1